MLNRDTALMVRTSLMRDARPTARDLGSVTTIAVDCLVRLEISGLTPPEIAEASGCGPVYARMLHTFVCEPVGSTVATELADSRVLVGHLTGRYRFDHSAAELGGLPHVREVAWSDILPKGSASFHRRSVYRCRLEQPAGHEVDGVIATFPLRHHPGAGRRVRSARPRAIQYETWDLTSIPPGLPRGPAPAYPEATEPAHLIGAPVPCPEGSNRCTHHTPHRLWHPLRAPGHPDGHDVVIVALNPSCPDGDTVSPRQMRTGGTVTNAEELLRKLRARSGVMVNLLTRRVRKPELLVAPASLPENSSVLEEAINGASLVVLAWGRSARELPDTAAESAATAAVQLVWTVMDRRPELLVTTMGTVTSGGVARGGYHPAWWHDPRLDLRLGRALRP